MNKYISKVSSLASRFDNEDAIISEAQYNWDEKTNTFSKNTQMDENTVMSEPTSSEEYYKNRDW